MLNIKKRQSKDNLVQSVKRAFDIIELLGRSSEAVGVTEIARELGLKTPTTHNLLRTLIARGYVSRDKNQRYRLGFGCGQLGQAYHFALRIPEVSRPAIEKLAGSLDESVVVAMMERGEIAFVAQASGTQMLAVNFEPILVEVGYTSVCGRVILAHLPPAELEEYIKVHPIAKGRTEDIRDRKGLDRVLEKVRKDGHLEYWRENNTVLAIAAPICDYTGSVVAAVGIGMPGVRFKKQEREKIVKAVEDTAERISAKLGQNRQEE